MTDERHDFAQARVRLEEIVTQVRKKDTSLERSLDLLEEGVRLANVCTELSDHTEWRNVIEEREEAEQDAAGPEGDAGLAGTAEPGDAVAADEPGGEQTHGPDREQADEPDETSSAG